MNIELWSNFTLGAIASVNQSLNNQAAAQEEATLRTSLTLLTIIIGLTAYIGTVRRHQLDRLKKDFEGSLSKEQNRKRKKLKLKIISLVLADAPLITSGCILAYHIYPDLNKMLPYSSLNPLPLFMFGIGILAIFHVSLWVRSLWELCGTPLTLLVQTFSKNIKSYFLRKKRIKQLRRLFKPQKSPLELRLCDKPFNKP